MELVQTPSKLQNLTNQDECRTAYGAAAMRAGDLQYKIRCYETELEAANDEMVEINKRSIEILKQTDTEPMTGAANEQG